MSCLYVSQIMHWTHEGGTSISVNFPSTQVCRPPPPQCSTANQRLGCKVMSMPTMQCVAMKMNTALVLRRRNPSVQDFPLEVTWVICRHSVSPSSLHKSTLEIFWLLSALCIDTKPPNIYNKSGLERLSSHMISNNYSHSYVFPFPIPTDGFLGSLHFLSYIVYGTDIVMPSHFDSRHV